MIEEVKIEKKKINYSKILKFLEYFFMIFGLICMFAQIKLFGVWEPYEDSTLMLMGLLLFNIGLGLRK